MRTAAGLLSGLVVASLLTGCGGGTSYCAAVKDHQSDLGSIAHGGSGTALLQALPIFEDLQGKAPDDVADDWQLLVTRVEALRTALSNAHVDPASYDPRHPPSGLSAEDRGLIRRAAAQLAASDTREALATVQQEVLDVCHTPLDL